MNAIKYCMISAILASAVFAQEPGFFVSVSGGKAQMKVADFAVYNPLASIPNQPLGEALPALDRKDSVSVASLTLGYAIDQSWDLRLSYSNYGTGEVQMAFPLYPGIFFATLTTPETYTRHALVYKSSSLTFIPTYSFALSEKLKFRGGIGVAYGMTAAHFEDARRAPLTQAVTYHQYAEFNNNSLSYVVALGIDYKFTEKLSLGIGVKYATMKADIPTSPWANRTKSSVNIAATSTELALTWHW